jgi:hypothetical protein
MKKILLYFLLASSGLLSASPHQAELDLVSVYLNSKLVGTWRANEGQVVYIDKIADGDTLSFIARTDVGGLGNSSIDVKDNLGVPVENIQSPGSTENAATFVYIFRIKKVDISKVSSLQVFLNVDPARNLPPPTIASISAIKK